MKTKIRISMLSLMLLIACTLLAQVPDKYGSSGPEQLGWRLAAQAYTFRLFTLEQTLDKLNELGLKYVELYPGQEIGAGIEGTTDFRMDEKSREKLKELLDRKGIKAVNYGVVGARTDEDWVRLFEFADAMGIETILSEPLVKDMDLIESLCDKHKIKLAIHNHPFRKERKHQGYYHPDIVLSVLAGRSKNMGAAPDIGHWVRSGVDPVEGIRRLKGRLVSFHFKDIREFGVVEAHDVPWGSGVCNIAGVMHELKELGFQGVFSIEYEHNWEDNMAEIAESIAYFNRVAYWLTQE